MIEITDNVLRSYITGKQSSDLYSEIVEKENELKELKELFEKEKKKEVILSSIVKAFNEFEVELESFTDNTEIVADIENALLFKVLEQLKDL
ncbi:MAG: hypothetical protein IM526_02965 [Microcystis sp. M38BS1]|uniref:hypothetical protein n=1 Tax=Microcystis sp. M38BS1 TaxID=2771188 RepID=UPI0031FCF609|nr:hypothetical protein [Microcystis sp. M38BS1]MCA6582624.1 hypothetical protein [Pseudanabaena sp. M34BS1SP1A06MG]